MNSNNISNKVVIFAEDKLYQKRKDIVETIEEIYASLDQDLKTIVDIRYGDAERNCFEWENIIDRL